MRSDRVAHGQTTPARLRSGLASPWSRRQGMSAEMTVPRPSPTGPASAAAADYRTKLTTAEAAMAAGGQRQRGGDGPVAVPAAGAAARPGASRQGQEHRAVSRSTTRCPAATSATASCASSICGVSSRYCLFFGATERELAARARAEGRGQDHQLRPEFLFRAGPLHPRAPDRRYLHDDGLADGRRGLLQFRHQQRLFVRPVPARRRESSSRSTATCRAVGGPARIHVSEVAAIVENDTPLEEFPVAPPRNSTP